MGYIMNKPTGKNVGEVLQGDMFQGLEHIPIYFGGPVRPDQIMFSAYWWAPDGEFSYRLRISAEEAVTMKSSAGCLLLAHVGHAGWSPGQLENELDEQSWVNTAVASEVISLNATKLWQSLLAQVSPFHALLSRTPQELRVN